MGFYCSADRFGQNRTNLLVACGGQKMPLHLAPIMVLNRDEILEQFEEFRKEIDEQKDKRERLIKVSQVSALVSRG